MNLPNAITIARIAATPAIAVLPFSASWQLRLLAFVLFVVAAATDYYDGMLARTRGLVTNLGKLLDPLADKLLLVGTLVPMYWLQQPLGDGVLDESGAAIGPAKWKTGFQCTWVGAAFFWFFALTLAANRGWTGAGWRAFAYFNGVLGVLAMAAAVALTVYSLWLYLRRYGRVLIGRAGSLPTR